ncbi:MAG: GatB/YqeY domain-containing protein [Chloroflexaceae bacterium]|nr:GatB/YqeY domain-containing protein [Chloroflexaceae bacterium]
MSLQEQLQTDLKEAMRNGERTRVNMIRVARAALQSAQLERDKQQYDEQVRHIEAQFANDPVAHEQAMEQIKDHFSPLDEAEQQAVIAREVKRREEAIELYRQTGKHERADQETAEVAILKQYLPRSLDADELRPQLAALIEEMGLSGTAAMSKLMPAAIKRFKGQADGRLISQLARELLT